MCQILVASVQNLNEHLFGVKQRRVNPYLLLAVGVQVVSVVPPELLPLRGRLGLELSGSCCATDPLLLFLVLPETQKSIDWTLQQNTLRLALSFTSHTRRPMILASLLKRGGSSRGVPVHITLPVFRFPGLPLPLAVFPRELLPLVLPTISLITVLVARESDILAFWLGSRQHVKISNFALQNFEI